MHIKVTSVLGVSCLAFFAGAAVALAQSRDVAAVITEHADDPAQCCDRVGAWADRRAALEGRVWGHCQDLGMTRDFDVPVRFRHGYCTARRSGGGYRYECEGAVDGACVPRR